MDAATESLRELEPRRVCLIKPSALGDVVHALPVLAALRDRWPRARFAWVVNRGLRGLLDGHPDLDEVIAFDRPSLRRPGRSLAFLGALRRRRFDLAIDLQGLLRSGLIARATGASVRVGRADAREGAANFYTHRIATGAAHAVDRLLAIAAAFGADVSRPRFEPVVGAEARAWAARTLGTPARPILTFNLGARWVTKRWSPNSFAELAARAHRRLGASIVAVGAPEDRDAVDSFSGGLADRGIATLDLCGRTTLPQLAAVAERSDLFVSNDTGPLHLAAATGARTLGIFLCTDPRKTGAYGRAAATVATRVWCAGSCLKSCPRRECLGELTPDRAFAALESALRRPIQIDAGAGLTRNTPG